MAESIAPMTLIDALQLIFPDFNLFVEKKGPRLLTTYLRVGPLHRMHQEAGRKEAEIFAPELHLAFNNCDKNFRPLAPVVATWPPLIGRNFAACAQG